MEDVGRGSRAPAGVEHALPPLAAVAGCWAATVLAASPSPRHGVALLAAGAALGGRARRIVVGLALGLIAAAVLLPSPSPPGIATRRPVTLEGRVESPWAGGAGEAPAAWLRARWVRQGGTVVPWRGRLRVSLAEGMAPPRAARLRLRGFLRRSAGLSNPVPAPPGFWRLTLKSEALLEALDEEGPAGRWRAFSASSRVEIRDAIRRSGRDRPGSLLVRALVLGEAEALPEAWRSGLRRLGLAHLMALSGLHVALVAILAWWVTQAAPTTVRGLSCAACVGLYVMLAGPRPSLLRAAAMAAVPLAATAAGRRVLALPGLAWVAAVICLTRPERVADLGFRLSFAATAGLLWWTPRLEAGWTRMPRWPRRMLAASVAAQLATLPLAVPAFHRVAPWAPVANLLAIPWTSAALAAGLTWAGLAVATPAAARLASPLMDAIAAPLRWTASFGDGGLSPAVAWNGWQATAVALAVLAVLCRPSSAARWVVVALVLAAIGGDEAFDGPEAVMFDVGQGEAVLLRDGAAALLVDGGGWPRGDVAARVTAPSLAALGIGRLQAVVLSHADRDHCRGLVQLAGWMRVEEVWTAPGQAGTRCLRDLLSIPGPALRPWRPGEWRQVGRWRLVALQAGHGEVRRGNDASLVVRADAEGVSVLFTGDIEAAGERRLLTGAPCAVRCDVLKIAHHGSRSSTTTAFLGAVAPRLALISAGRGNSYGHPSPVVTGRLAAAGVPTLRTDRSGWIRLRLEGGGRIRIEPGGRPEP